MPLRINRVALGLLSYFDSKNAGQPPQQVADAISCGVDLAPFLYAQQAVDLFGQVASASTGVVGVALASNFMGVGGGAFRVPPGEVWLCKHLTVRTNGALPAATDYMFSVGYQSILPTIAGGACWYSLGDPIQVGPWQVGHAPLAAYTGEWVMVPGDQVGCFISRVAVGTAQTLEVSLRAIRLPM